MRFLPIHDFRLIDQGGSPCKGETATYIYDNRLIGGIPPHDGRQLCRFANAD